MIVVGGSYYEHCGEPPDREFFGSGLRAACALSTLCDIEFITAIDDRSQSTLQEVADLFGVSVRATPRTSPIGFDYLTPLSRPGITGRGATADPIAVDGDLVLAFGMIEATVQARASKIVLDPQRPRELVSLDRGAFETERLALVANASESRLLSGRDDLEEAARTLLDTLSAEVVITKCGARGALVTTATNQTLVGAFPTRHVWPIGSGDVFAALFAWAWGLKDESPESAALIASKAASIWCSTRRLDFRETSFEGLEGSLQPREGRVYLAAPFFNLPQRWLVQLTYDNLLQLGADVFSPLHDVGRGGDEVAEKDLAGVQGCTSLLALLDDADPGTVFEAGWATRDGISVIAYAENPHPEGIKMLRGSGAEIHRDLSTAVYRAIWASYGMAL